MLLITRSIFLLITRAWPHVIFWGHVRSQPHARFCVRFLGFVFLCHIFNFLSAYFSRASFPQVLSTGLVEQDWIWFNLSHLHISLHKQPVFKKYFHLLEHNNVDSSFWFLPAASFSNLAIFFSFCFFLALFIHFTFKERENYLWIFPKCQTLSTIVTAD